MGNIGLQLAQIIRITQESELLGPRLPNSHCTDYFYVHTMHIYCYYLFVPTNAHEHLLVQTDNKNCTYIY